MVVDSDKIGLYILQALEQISLNGDAFTTEDPLFRQCLSEHKDTKYTVFKQDLAYLIQNKLVIREGRRLYLRKIWRYEESTAKMLSEMLPNNHMDAPDLPPTLSARDIILTEEQRQAVEMGLSHRISLILGGAGTGKSTLVQSIVKEFCGNTYDASLVLCAPTGKAARNLTKITGISARTVHSALGMRPHDDFLQPVLWHEIDLVVVDEASMMTLEMMAGILARVRQKCHIVLVGDPCQLLSVGAGNIILDLLALGCPHVKLNAVHRQDECATALSFNVKNFETLTDANSLAYDHSFSMVTLAESKIAFAIMAEALSRYEKEEDILVLSPYNAATDLSVKSLNDCIAPKWNPRTDKKRYLSIHGKGKLWDGDCVMITKNNRDHNCSNGDIGILHIACEVFPYLDYSVSLPDGRCPRWTDASGLAHLTMAYALTVHKSQGSQCDTVLLPVTTKLSSMLIRNLFYTAISRAKKQVILFGHKDSIHKAMQTVAPPRASLLVAKTRMLIHKSA